MHERPSLWNHAARVVSCNVECVFARNSVYWLTTVAFVIYPVALNFDWIPRWFSPWAVTIYVLAVGVLLVVESGTRMDIKDFLRVIREGLASVDSALENLYATPGRRRLAKFQDLYRIATNAITGLANPKQVQAQLFWVHDHADHQHLVSIYASNGNLQMSRNHFSSIGDAVDRRVWTRRIGVRL